LFKPGAALGIELSFKPGEILFTEVLFRYTSRFQSYYGREQSALLSKLSHLPPV
jgi:hypothetical protein